MYKGIEFFTATFLHGLCRHRPWLMATMYNRAVTKQKIDYMHYNPVKAGLCEKAEDYYHSSARYYELNKDDWGILTHSADHLGG